MAKTTLLVVGAVTPVAVVPQQNGTTRILLYESAGGSTAGIIWMAPSSGDTQITRPAGALLEFDTREGTKGTGILGYLLAVSGSLNIVQEEYP